MVEEDHQETDDTVVAPAHYSDAATPNDDGTYTAELGDLTDRMDALSMDETEFVEFVVSHMPPQPANYEDIIATNLGQQHPDDQEAFSSASGSRSSTSAPLSPWGTVRFSKLPSRTSRISLASTRRSTSSRGTGG